VTRPQLFAARPWGRAEPDCFGIRAPSARRLVAAALISEKNMDIYGYRYGYAIQYRRAAYLPHKHPLIGETCELNSAHILRGRLSLLDLAVKVFELAQRMGGFSMAELSKWQAQTAIW
jgi:hypothetical protein